ncbi:hypothetical protein Tco_0158409 [Tanacetum coccineum]
MTGRINAIEQMNKIPVSVHGVNVSAWGVECVAYNIDDINLAQVLKEMKSTKPKKKGLLYKSWVNLQQQYLHNYLHNNHMIKIDADHQLAERMQAQEQEELSIEEKDTIFQQLLEKRRKHFAAKRVEEKRNKPPTKAQ